MKVDIVQGCLVISPENGTEAFAMARWMELNAVQVDDQLRRETTYIRGSRLLVETAPLEKKNDNPPHSTR